MTWEEIKKSRAPEEPEEAKEETSRRSDSFSSDDIDALLDGKTPMKKEKPQKKNLFEQIEPTQSDLETKILSTLLPNLADLGEAPLPKMAEVLKPTETSANFVYNSDLCNNSQDEEACEVSQEATSKQIEIKGEEKTGTAEKVEKFSMDFEMDSDTH